MNQNMILVQKKFNLRKQYEETTGQQIKTNPGEYRDWLECQLILLREKETHE